MSDDKPDMKKSRSVRAARSEQSIDRLPPHSEEAERGVLGCVLLSPNDTLNECITGFKMGGDVFYDVRHQTIYATMVAMRELNQPIDLITLSSWLKDNEELEQVGGMAYLAGLPDAVPVASNLNYYADYVREKYLLRKMIRTCTEVVGKVYDNDGSVEELIDWVEKEILQVRNYTNVSESKGIKDLVHRAVDMIEKQHERKGAIMGLNTGFLDLDRILDGMHNGEMIVIAARPSIGKTSLSMNIVEHVALEQKLPVGVFSLEMTAESLVMRMICSHARVNLRAMRDGFLTERDMTKLTTSSAKIMGSQIYIEDEGGLTIMQLRAKARRLHQQHGIKLLVIDYLQLLRSETSKAENRQQEIADISNGIKALTKELNIPVIVLSQLNRELEKDKSRKPRLSDLRESGAIEQDADVVGLLYRPRSVDDDDNDEQSEAMPVNMLIAKQRNGPTGDVNLTFLKSFTRFESAAKVSDEDVPPTNSPHND